MLATRTRPSSLPRFRKEQTITVSLMGVYGKSTGRIVGIRHSATGKPTYDVLMNDGETVRCLESELS